jgi:hypothetical protein
MQQTLEDGRKAREETMKATADATVIEYVTQSDAYRNRLVREHAGSWNGPHICQSVKKIADICSAYRCSQRLRWPCGSQDFEEDQI